MSSFFPFSSGGGASGAVVPADDALEPLGHSDDVDGMFADIAEGLLDDDLEEELASDPMQRTTSLFNRRGREDSVGSTDTTSSASDDDDGSGSGSGIGAPSFQGLGTELWGRRY